MRVARWLGMVLMLLAVIVALGCSQPGTPKTAKGPTRPPPQGRRARPRPRAARRHGRRLGRRQVPRRVHRGSRQARSDRVHPGQQRQERRADQGRQAAADHQGAAVPNRPEGHAPGGRPRRGIVTLRRQAREARPRSRSSPAPSAARWTARLTPATSRRSRKRRSRRRSERGVSFPIPAPPLHACPRADRTIPDGVRNSATSACHT